MKTLLEKAKSAEIGQSDIVLEEANAALSVDFEGLHLISRHKATITAHDLFIRCLRTASRIMNPKDKQQVYNCLLRPTARVSTELLSDIMAQSFEKLPGDMQLPQILIAHGARVKFKSPGIVLTKCALGLLKTLISDMDTKMVKEAF
jgi:hypothetical protein